MRIIALANQKGGVGKTTTTVNLAGRLAEMGQKVILVDLDPQAHLTTFMGIDPVGVTRSSYTVLTQGDPMAEALLEVRENLKLLGAELNLAAAEQELVSVMGRETRLREALAGYEEPCDYVFVDCPPSLGLLTLNALGAAREVFIPLQPHFLSLQGLSQLLETLMLVQKRINPELQVSGLLFCMFDARTTLTTEIVRDIEEFFARQRDQESPWQKIRIFRTRIRRNVKLAESPSHGRTIFEYEPNCHGARDYGALAEEVEAMTAEEGEVEIKEAVEEEPVVRSNEEKATETIEENDDEESVTELKEENQGGPGGPQPEAMGEIEVKKVGEVEVVKEIGDGEKDTKPVVQEPGSESGETVGEEKKVIKYVEEEGQSSIVEIEDKPKEKAVEKVN